MKKLSSLLLILFLICCTNSPNETGDKFGATYSLETTADIPAIQNNSLITMVSYKSCNSTHSFTLKSESLNNRIELWLFKQTPDQLCDMLVRERKAFELNQKILDAQNIILLGPDDHHITLK